MDTWGFLVQFNKTCLVKQTSNQMLEKGEVSFTDTVFTYINC